ncbi:transglycosylase SLT domain-containing protein [Mesorhizobium sp. NPDC059054]|uniref:transglycosylase SLT domain-containing protein n=1 Tax=Mesorhizobium sp. NPDC059054 TaxID=3346711 RepID=UPI0036A80467
MNALVTLRVALGFFLAVGLGFHPGGSARAQDAASAKLGLDIYRPWTGDFDGMVKRRVIRFLVPYSKTVYFIDKGEQLGTAVDRGRALEKELNRARKKADEQVIVVFLPMPRDQLIPALNQGLGDIVAGSLTVTPERRSQADFSAPFESNVKEVLVTGPSAPAILRIEDLSGRDVHLRKSSSYYEHLLAANDQLKTAKLAPINLVPVDETLEDEDLLEMVNADLLPYTFMDDYRAGIWSKVFTNIKVRSDIAIAEGGDIAWAIRKNSPLLKAEVDAFARSHEPGTAFGNMLKSRYYSNERIVRRALAPEALARFAEIRGYFQRYGTQFGFEHLLIMAQGYQESQLDQQRRSARGAVGIMQLLPSTAASKEVGVPDIVTRADDNIRAGTKYLRYLITTYVDDPAIDDFNRMLFAFAAYNAGPGNLHKFRARATAMGLDHDKWFGNVEHAAAAIVGRETVQYVSNIRKYYIAYTLSERIERTRADQEQAAGSPHAEAETSPVEAAK